ncbi:interleukin-17B-like [Heterodontus francisci]|uniref:interleukin-17B-like n=1 Tax=Heterodontus francisci TaxID=7792 RepID=UPI00355B482E
MVFFHQKTLTVSIMSILLASVMVAGSKSENKALRGKKNSQARTRSPDPAVEPIAFSRSNRKFSLDPVHTVNSLTDREFMLEENYEQNVREMVNQLKNNSALTGTNCEVNLQFWMSNTRSLSPWAYSINHDDERIPIDIPEAKCLCKGCINPFTMQEDTTMSSILIYSKIPVKRLMCESSKANKKYRRKKKKCILQYKAVIENIAVGCTCIF